MRILIGKPTVHLEMFDAASKQGLFYNSDVVELYDILPEIIEGMGIECINIEMQKSIRRVYQEKDSIFLAWHNHGTTPNTWFIKQGYVPDYFYFDKTGYSGWSELADKYEHDVDVDAIRPEVEKIADYYISNNISRFDQTYKEEIPDNPYVLVFEQREDDAVSIFARVHNIGEKVKEAFKDTKYDVVVKPHPLDLEHIPNTGWRWSVNDKTGSLHKLLANCSAVYTVNSSAGFEALLHNKRVFTAGHSDFHWATDSINDEADIRKSIELLDEPVDTDRITKFLHYCFTEHFMNVKDRASIERKIQKAVDHYESLRRNRQ